MSKEGEVSWGERIYGTILLLVMLVIFWGTALEPVLSDDWYTDRAIEVEESRLRKLHKADSIRVHQMQIEKEKIRKAEIERDHIVDSIAKLQLEIEARKYTLRGDK